ncbi:transglutaminase-like domain-containing protein [Fluviicola chungangensis]|uniref:Transglutaminase domain-containing protein n=1 Tax=Fluviicola chungangensis TaxID=2597671 RepID=A0A556MJ41_9FLAO|nr:transglutaminase-like domain-containing protein [Fluviicola chungangensis]TSJ39937.1 transglutaminase domain-containing protein [Fluviicola chungangensis]
MRLILTILILLLTVYVLGQKKLKVLHTNVKSFRMKYPSDPAITKRTWTIVPDLKPDSVIVSDTKIQFITDVDSTFIKVDKKHPVCDFLVIYQHKDTCWTRVRYYEVPDYIGKLKKAAKYNTADVRTVPEFTYQDSSNTHLKALREKYNLDSIAGDAGEFNQIINLMHWIHNLVRHDGQHGNPENKNADELIKACSDGSRGLNCRGLAISLNECYLAMGFKSRYVTCMPKELEFDDCHVINMVYSEWLQKWVYMDPTNNAYVMDEKGTLLSIEEVRQRLIDGRTLIVNPDANWNNEQFVWLEGYLHSYMAKNLYRLECPVSSEYDYETKSPGKNTVYIELLPLDGLNQTPQKSDHTNNDTDFTVTRYVTNNPELFWKAPKSDHTKAPE